MMAVNKNFNLALDLARFVPSESLVSSTFRNTINLAREFRKSGSDIVTETDLAEFFGVHKIEPNLASSFRTLVKDSALHKLGVALDIVLESGAGPTVRHSLMDSRYFSTVVQISLLTWTHELNSLAKGLSQVLARKMELREPEQRTYHSYDSLLGTMRVFREQTASFKWLLLLQAVEESLGSVPTDLKRLASRNLPVSILQGCLDFFFLAQSLPEDRLIHIKTHTGYATLVVWAHHVLGLNVTVLDRDQANPIKFGTGEENVVIVVGGSDINICLLDGSGDEIFRLVPSPDDPILGAEVRYLVEGIGYRLLENEPDPPACVEWIMYFCEKERWHQISLQRLQSTSRLIFGDLFDNTAPYARQDYDSVVKTQRLHEQTIRACKEQNISASLSHTPEGDSAHSGKNDEVKKGGSVPQRPPLSSWVLEATKKMLLALTCIANQEILGELPVTTSAIQEMKPNMYVAFNPFSFLSALILGHQYNEIATIGEEDVALVSACGWSLYVSTIRLPDPANVIPMEFFIAKGVPSYYGERKHYIIDGPPLGLASVDWSSKPYQHTDKTLPLSCLLDISKPQMFVSIVGPSFEVLVKFEILDRVDGKRRSVRCGYRTLNEAILFNKKTKPCEHPKPVLENHAWDDDCKLIIPPFNYKSYRDSLPPCTPDQVLLSITTGSSIAKWLTIMTSLRLFVFLKSNDSCLQCTIAEVKDYLQNNSIQEERIRKNALAGGPKFPSRDSPTFGIVVL